MEQKQIIPITCKGQKYMPLGKLEDFQGDLKTLPAHNEKKLRQVILKHGFSFPVFVWKQSIIDGHQRLKVLKSLLAEGYQIKGGIPVVEIEAADEKEAAEKLLLMESHYGQVTEAGLLGFIDNFDLDPQGLIDEIDLPDLDIDKLLADDLNAGLPDDTTGPEATSEPEPDTITLKIVMGRPTYDEIGQDVLKKIEQVIKPYGDLVTMQLTE
jgi:hypothetical protein